MSSGPRCPAAPRDFRREVITVLTAVSSAPPEISPEALLRAWFEEAYLPAGSYLEALKGDFSPQAAAAFNDSFSQEERALLERFHRFLELRLELLRKLPGGLAAAQGSPLWESIRSDARNTLSLLTTAERLEN